MKEIKNTDWNQYYQRPYSATSITRKMTTWHIHFFLKKYLKPKSTIAELGGANSCFIDYFKMKLSPSRYDVFDSNELGLDKLKERKHNESAAIPTSCHLINLLEAYTVPKYDMAFSVGLIEHFDKVNTQKIFLKHFEFLNENGFLLVTFPTPTFLYKITRFIAEILGLWIFFDERPISPQEIKNIIPPNFHIAHSMTIWPIFLTQHLLLIKRNNL